MVSGSNRRIVDGAATFGAIFCEDSNGDKASAEENINAEAEEGKKGDAAQEARQDDGESSVDDRPSRHAFDSLLPFRNMGVVVGKVCEVSVEGRGHLYAPTYMRGTMRIFPKPRQKWRTQGRGVR